ncbi:hypothetical protein EB796_019818 [Bugula neritina]|uniref:Uncharacterized protein n=1 Tax=Bugula neritina TaxID=10212 RepID=A0A7J7J888_BUGNE|nr:hypothetical protein EB796_019818 [Bugula neritina]
MNVYFLIYHAICDHQSQSSALKDIHLRKQWTIVRIRGCFFTDIAVTASHDGRKLAINRANCTCFPQ